MTWLTWRQHRIEVLVMSIALLGCAIALLVVGIDIALEAQRIGFTPCTGNTSACFRGQHGLQIQAMQIYIDRLTQTQTFSIISLTLPYILPVLAGIFIGAPALSREFEQGTYRLLWTQGIPWSRWFFKKTGLLILTVACAFAILFGLLSWWSASLSYSDWFHGYFNSRFDTWGVVIVAYAVFAVALGLFVGTVVRKPVAAMAITLVLFIVVRVLVVNYWRPYYLPPVVAIAPMNVAIGVPGDSWIVSDTLIDRHGQSVSFDDVVQVCGNFQNSTCLNAHGFRNKMVYQPPDRYWPLQWIESGIYLLFTAILLALAYVWIKYRIIGGERKIPLRI